LAYCFEGDTLLIFLELLTSCIMESRKSIWDTINVPLPELQYKILPVVGQEKSSTVWAAQSHTPLIVAEWTEFSALVQAEGRKNENAALVVDINPNTDLGGALVTHGRRSRAVSSEQDMTALTIAVLDIFSSGDFGALNGYCFSADANLLISKPDILAMKDDPGVLRTGPWEAYSSPDKGKKAGVRRDGVQAVRSLYIFPIETKPVWKFNFLTGPNAHQIIIDEWEIPDDFDVREMRAAIPLPEDWPPVKKKVFHLVRQLYDHMVAGDFQYGILHVYERWFFCKRTQEGDLFVSRSFAREETSPSVLQAIKTMFGFTDHTLIGASIHPKSASNSPDTKKPKPTPDAGPPPSSGGAQASSNLGGQGSQTIASSNAKNLAATLSPCDCRVYNAKNLAATLSPCDCRVYDATDNILLLTSSKYPFILVKLQQNPKKYHVAEEMGREAEIYAALADNAAVQKVIPTFHGHSTHLGVAMTCIERELDDLEDIGLENVSDALKQSAVDAVRVLSTAGLLHNDLELRNIVQSKDDPDRVKIIDFGRAFFTLDQQLLAKQVERVQRLLGLT
jgi:hypothetical protein